MNDEYFDEVSAGVWRRQGYPHRKGHTLQGRVDNGGK